MNNNIPQHIAVIMDGNSRWAKKNGLPKKKGYEEGIKTLRKLIDHCIENNIQILTVYALSTENKYRDDIDILYTLAKEFIKDNNIINEFKYVKFNLLGERNNIPKEILFFFEKLEKNNNYKKKINFNLAFNYGAWKEVENCIKNIIKLSNQLKKININEELINNNLYTKNIPNPDILIRTGGQKRLSNFLLLQLKYTELFFLDTLWPDFTHDHLKDILVEFNNRNRNFGL
ncbi:MAG: di-trans,poly-cis-decaprenylcistransferase [Pelagibacteraceae bacterium]|nr:di-trans,poly-cis-decaprenylcistransferase [Pelagibacteraceae bacterium]